MKKFKFIVCFCCLLLLTGCNADINLIVSDNGKVINNTKITVEKSFMDSLYNNTTEIKNYYNSLISEYDKNVKLNVKYDNDLVVASLKNDSKINNLKGIYEVILYNVEINDNSYVIKTKDLKNYFSPDLEIDVEKEGLLESLNINIQFFNKVISSNSDYKNDSKNTFTWTFSPNDFDKTIEFTLSDEKRYDIIIPYLLNKYIGLVILLIIVVTIAIGILFIVQKSKKENQI